MKVTISTPGKFQPAYLWARWLEEREQLERIVSLTPHARTAQFGVSGARTTAIMPFGAWNHAFQRFAPAGMQGSNQLAVSAAFDRTVAHMLGGCDVFNGWSSTSLHSIRSAHRRGMPTVLQCGSAHIVAQTAILQEEHRRLGLGAVTTHPGVIERTLAEYEEADAIVVPSTWVRRTFVEQGVDAEKLRVIHEVTLPLEVAPPSLLQASRRLSAPATLRLVGQRDDELYARAGGLPERCEAIGPRSGAALAAEYAKADIFVLPSVEDGFGLVVAEAMAAGLPVVVSDQAGAADLVIDRVNGFVVRARDVDALVARIDLLANDAALRERMGAAARETASGRTWQSYGEQMWRDVYAPLAMSEKAAA